MLERAAVEAGRDPREIGMEGQATWRGSPDRLAEQTRSWQEAGCTHMSVNTMGAGLRSVDEHLAVLQTAAEVTRPYAE